MEAGMSVLASGVISGCAIAVASKVMKKENEIVLRMKIRIGAIIHDLPDLM
jgi:hypothetical protein